MARVGFDGLMVSPQGKGHSRSQLHALEALAALGEHEIVAFMRRPRPLENVEVVHVDPRLTLDWELRGVVAAARRHHLDAFVTLSERLPPASGPPTVVWLFESPVHRIRANRESRAPVWHRASDLVTGVTWQGSLRRAAHVAFGSKATFHEVLADIPLRSTSVVYPGLPPGFSPGVRREGDPYAFHVGSNDPRDDTALAVDACRRAGVRLLVAGGWRGEGAEALGRVTDEQLLELYRGAAVYVDPTRYEGFGYGVLEAMACGAPVVASRVTSIPEVVGEAGLLCEPGSVDQFAEAVGRVVDDEALRGDLRVRGIARAREFTWEKAAAGLSAAIAAALS